MIRLTSCPDAARWKELLDGSLTDAEVPAFNAHLETCAICQRTLEGLAACSAAWAGVRRHLGRNSPGGDAMLQRVLGELESAVDGTATAIQANTAPSLDFLTAPDGSGTPGRFGPYEVRKVVGRGAMGVVLEVFDEKLQRVVALKVTAPQLATDSTARQRFIREAQSAAAVRDEHVVNVHDAGEVNGLPYLVMEFVAGVSLQQRLEQAGPLEIREAVRIAVEAARGLAAAHAQGLIHRDVKPANILIEEGTGRVKLTDFGLARAVDDASLSRTGVVAGTPAYMAPEQARGEPLDHRADIHALGATLYELLAGQPAFAGGNVQDVLRCVAQDEPPPLRRWNRAVPADVETIVHKAMAKEPSERYGTARELADDLERFLKDETILARPPSLGQRARKWARRHRTIVAAAGVAFLVTFFVLAVSAAWVTWAYQAEKLQRQAAEENARARDENAQKAEANFRKAENQGQAARLTVDDLLNSVSQETLLNEPGMQPLRRKLLERALGYYLKFLAEWGDDPTFRAEAARAHFRVAEITYLIGSADDAKAEYEKARAIQETLARDDPSAWNRTALAETYNNLGVLYIETGPLDRAFNFLRQARSLLVDLVDANPEDVGSRQRQALAHANLGLAHYREGNFDEAMKSYQRGLDLRETLAEAGRADPHRQDELATSLNNIALLEMDSGKLDDALRTYGRVIEIYQQLTDTDRANVAFQSRLAIAHYNSGLGLRDGRRFDDALREYAKARVIQRRLVEANPLVSLHRRDLARTEFETGWVLPPDRAREALRAFEDARLIQEKLERENPSVSEFVRDLAMTYRALGERQARYEEKMRLFQWARERLARLTRENPSILLYQADLGRNYCELGRAEQQAGHLTEALRWFEQARDQLQELTDANPRFLLGRLYLTTAFTYLGDCQEKSGRKEDARRSLDQARAIHEALIAEQSAGGASHQDLARILLRLARLEQGANQMAATLSLLEKARTLLEALRKERPKDAGVQSDWTQVRWSIAAHHVAVGWDQSRAGLGDEALWSFLQAADLYQNLADENPTHAGSRHELARTLARRAELLKQARRLGEAEASWNKARTLWQELTKQFPGEAEYPHQIGGVLNNLASRLLERGEAAEARSLYRQAITYQLAALEIDPKARFAREWLCNHYLGLARTLEQLKDPEGVLDAYQKAIPIESGLADEFPDETEYRSRLGELHTLVAVQFRLAGRLKDCEKAHADALKVRQGLARQSPDSPAYQSEVGASLNNLANVLADQKQFQKARELLERAVEIQRAALKSDPKNSTYRTFLRNHHANLAGVLAELRLHAETARAAVELPLVFSEGPAEYIRAAQFLSLCVRAAERDEALSAERRQDLMRNYGDQALGLLREGVARGYTNAAALKNLPVLEPIRSREDFKKMLEELEAKPKP
jgi:tetratricopeptide (TPR) repeat protein